MAEWGSASVSSRSLPQPLHHPGSKPSVPEAVGPIIWKSPSLDHLRVM